MITTPIDILDKKLETISYPIYEKIKEDIYNFPENDLLIYDKLGYSYRSNISKKAKIVSGFAIAKDNLVLHLNSIKNTVILLHATLSHTNSLIFTNFISPYFRGEWIQGDELLNQYNVNLEIYTFTGYIIPYTYYKIKSSLVNNNTLYIAINSNIFNICDDLEFGESFYMKLSLNDVFKENYQNKCEILSFNSLINTKDQLSSILDNINSNFNKITDIVYINGYSYLNLAPINRKASQFLNNEIKYLTLDYIKNYKITDLIEIYDYELKDYNYISNINNDSRIMIYYKIDNIINQLKNKIITIDQIDIYLRNEKNDTYIKFPYILKNNIIDRINNIKKYNTLDDVLKELLFYNKISNSQNSIIFQYDYFDLENIGNTINQVDNIHVSILKEYLNYIKSIYNIDNYSFIIKIQNNKSKSLINNNTFLEWLYRENMTDVEIKSFLLNSSYIQDIFNIQSLEINTYIQNLFKLPDKHNYKDIIQYAIDSYGYLEFNNSICKSIYNIKITDINRSIYTINKSSFYNKERCSILVYLNGKLLINEYGYADFIDYIEIGLDIDDLNIQENDVLIIRIIPLNKLENINFLDDLLTISLEDNKDTILIEYCLDYTTFTPSSSQHQILLDLSKIVKSEFNNSLYDYDVYLFRPINTDEKVPTGNYLKGRYIKINEKNNIYFKKIINFHENTIYFNFYEDSYGYTFLFVPKNYYSLHIKKYNIPNPKYIPINFLLDINSIPIVNYDNIEIYLNGYELYPNTDYKITEIKNEDNTISGYWLSIQSNKFIQDSNNIDIFITSEMRYDNLEEQFYGVNQYISCNKKLNFPYLDICKVSVNGKFISKYEYNMLDGCIDINENIDKYPYRISYLIPLWIHNNFNSKYIDYSIMNNLLGVSNDIPSPYNSDIYQFSKYNQDTTLSYHDRLLKLKNNGYLLLCKDNEYIKGLNEEYEYSYNLSSDYKNNIISLYGSIILYKIINNEISIKPDITTDEIIELLKPYEYLKKYDLLLNENNLIYNQLFNIFTTLYPVNSDSLSELLQPIIDDTRYSLSELIESINNILSYIYNQFIIYSLKS